MLLMLMLSFWTYKRGSICYANAHHLPSSTSGVIIFDMQTMLLNARKENDIWTTSSWLESNQNFHTKDKDNFIFRARWDVLNYLCWHLLQAQFVDICLSRNSINKFSVYKAFRHLETLFVQCRNLVPSRPGIGWRKVNKPC